MMFTAACKNVDRFLNFAAVLVFGCKHVQPFSAWSTKAHDILSPQWLGSNLFRSLNQGNVELLNI